MLATLVPESWLDSPWFTWVTGPFFLLLTLLVIIHALRTGRPTYWLTILLFFPGIGVLAYFFVEILPSLRLSPGGAWKAILRMFETKAFRLKTFAENFEESRSINNLTLFAKELADQKKWPEAEDVVDQWSDRRNLDDEDFLETYLNIKLNRQKADQVITLLEQSPRQSKTPGLRRLWVLALLQMKRIEEAEQFVRADRVDSEVFILGLQAEVALAKGDKEGAKILLRGLKKRFRQGNRIYRRMEYASYSEGCERLSEIAR